MFLDINGNTFSTLGNQNQMPVFDLNPRQIFGDNLLLWTDLTDKSTLFTNTACTTNVTTYGDFIRGIRDKSSYGKILRATGDTANHYIWTSNTFNNLGCAYKITTATTATQFNHEDTTFALTANTDFFVGIVCRFFSVPIAGFHLPYGFGSVGGGGIGTVAAFGNNLSYWNLGSQAFSMAAITPTNLTVATGSFKILTISSSHTLNILNTYAISGQSNRSFGYLYQSGRMTLLTLLPQNGFAQEVFIARGQPTSEQFNFAHQYLRLKYGGT